MGLSNYGILLLPPILQEGNRYESANDGVDQDGGWNISPNIQCYYDQYNLQSVASVDQCRRYINVPYGLLCL